MPNVGVTGEILEVSRSRGRVCLEWRIRRFLQLACGDLDFYESPLFFCDACWFMRVFPNSMSLGRVSLFLRRIDGVPSPKTVHVSVGLKGSDGVQQKRGEVGKEFENTDVWFFGYVCTRRELIEQRHRLVQDDALVIVCQMETPDSTDRDYSDPSTQRDRNLEDKVLPGVKQSSKEQGVAQHS